MAWWDFFVPNEAGRTRAEVDEAFPGARGPDGSFASPMTPEVMDRYGLPHDTNVREAARAHSGLAAMKGDMTRGLYEREKNPLDLLWMGLEKGGNVVDRAQGGRGNLTTPYTDQYLGMNDTLQRAGIANQEGIVGGLTGSIGDAVTNMIADRRKRQLAARDKILQAQALNLPIHPQLWKDAGLTPPSRSPVHEEGDEVFPTTPADPSAGAPPTAGLGAGPAPTSYGGAAGIPGAPGSPSGTELPVGTSPPGPPPMAAPPTAAAPGRRPTTGSQGYKYALDGDPLHAKLEQEYLQAKAASEAGLVPKEAVEERRKAMEARREALAVFNKRQERDPQNAFEVAQATKRGQTIAKFAEERPKDLRRLEENDRILGRAETELNSLLRWDKNFVHPKTGKKGRWRVSKGLGRNMGGRGENPFTATMHRYQPNIPGGAAAEALATLTGLQELLQGVGMQMTREKNPTGGAGGQTSEREWPKFEKLLANLSIDLSEERMAENLADLQNQIYAMKLVSYEEYDAKHGTNRAENFLRTLNKADQAEVAAEAAGAHERRAKIVAEKAVIAEGALPEGPTPEDEANAYAGYKGLPTAQAGEGATPARKFYNGLPLDDGPVYPEDHPAAMLGGAPPLEEEEERPTQFGNARVIGRIR